MGCAWLFDRAWTNIADVLRTWVPNLAGLLCILVEDLEPETWKEAILLRN